MTNTDNYNYLVDDTLEKIEKIKESRQTARYNEIYKKAKEEIDKNER